MENLQRQRERKRVKENQCKKNNNFKKDVQKVKNEINFAKWSKKVERQASGQN